MSLRFFCGADFFDYGRMDLFFRTSGSIQGSNQAGVFSADSRYVDYSMNFLNSGFSRFTAEIPLIDTQPEGVTFGFYLKIDRAFGSWDANLDVFQLRYQAADGDPITRHLAINISADRRLRFFKAGTVNNTGDMIYQTDPGFIESGFHWYEFQIKNSGPDNLRVWVDGDTDPTIEATVSTVNGTTAATYSLAGFVFDQLGFNNITWDNFYLRDDASEDRYGPVRVTLHSIKNAPDGDLFIGGWGVGGSMELMPTWGGRLRELIAYPAFFTRPPDDDNSYMFTNMNDQKAIFRFERYWPVGPIISLALSMVAKTASGSPAKIAGLVRRFSFDYLSGEFDVPGGDVYRGIQIQYEAPPSGGDSWVEQELVSGDFTFGFSGSKAPDNTLRVTQFVVQMLHLISGSGSEYRIF